MIAALAAVFTAIFAFTGLLAAGVVALRIALQARVRAGRRFDTADSIDELAAWRIGGIDQWVQLRGASRTHPILLYLHGGPGMPAMPFAYDVLRNWETRYIVVHWDQRNAGKTLTSNGVQDDVSLEQHVGDGLEIVAELRRRFPNNRLVLFGQSWGTALAIEMLRRGGFDCAAYVANGQVSDFLKAERYGYETVLTEARRLNDQETVEKLLRYEDYPHVEPLAPALGAVRAAEFKLGFAHHGDPGIMLCLLWRAFQSPDYGWRDLLSLQNRKAQAVSLRLALNELPHFAERAAGAVLPCPIIVTGGEFDLFTPTPMARAFFETLQAPTKLFIDLPGVAHFGPNEAPEAFDAILLDTVLPLLAHSPAPRPAAASQTR